MRSLPLAVVTGLAILAGCGVTDLRLPPSTPNVVDTVTLSALSAPGLSTPSAFSVANNTTVKTWQSTNFDFAYDLRAGKHELLPLQALGFVPVRSTNPGLFLASVPFDSIKTAPLNGYIFDSAQVVAPDDVYYARSAIVCSTTGTPSYGKLEILSFDDSAKTITFKVLADINCDYHDLTLGLPSN
ncbi:MAG: hypothetical protein ACHQXA_10040 [Gemmatimonadales bacterium]